MSGARRALATLGVGAGLVGGVLAISPPDAFAGRADLVQIGLFASRGDAEWAWISLTRRAPALASQLTREMAPAPGGGVLLRARTSGGGAAACRELLRVGTGCFVVTEDSATQAAPATMIVGRANGEGRGFMPIPGVKPPVPGQEGTTIAQRVAPPSPGSRTNTDASKTVAAVDTTPDARLTAPPTTTATMVDSGASDSGAVTLTAVALPPTNGLTVSDAPPAPAVKPPPPETNATSAAAQSSASLAIASPAIATTAPAPATKAAVAGGAMPVAGLNAPGGLALGDVTGSKPIAAVVTGQGAIIPTPGNGATENGASVEVPPPPSEKPMPIPAALTDRTLDGFIRYSTDDAKVLAEIERRTRRRGRIGAVVPAGGLAVTPAILTQPEFNICALTFDDGPHRTVTRRILEILSEEKVVATYFPVGNVASRYPDIIRDWVAAGHEIGNHSFTHGDLRSMRPEQQRHEIADTNRVLRSLGATSILFRPPYGRYNQDLLRIAREEGSETVLWNVDTRDWQVRDPDRIVEHVTTAAGSGSVLLMHSTYPSTASALPRVIASLRAKKCEFVTLSDWLVRMRQAGELPVTNASLPQPRVVHARN